MGIKLNPFTGQFDIAGSSSSEGESVLLFPTFADFPDPTSLNPGSLALALDTDILYVTNGTAWVPISGPDVFANKTLSNLNSPTAINQSLVPGTDATIDLGSLSASYKDLFINGSIKNTSSSTSTLLINDVAGQGVRLQSSAYGVMGIGSSGLQISGPFGGITMGNTSASGLSIGGPGGSLVMNQNALVFANSVAYLSFSPSSGTIGAGSLGNVSFNTTSVSLNAPTGPSIILGSSGVNINSVSSGLTLNPTTFSVGGPWGGLTLQSVGFSYGGPGGSLSLSSVNGFQVSGATVGSPTGGSFFVNQNGLQLTNSLGSMSLTAAGFSVSSATAGTNISLAPGVGGAVSVNSSLVKNVSNPVDPQDAATKNYVDAAITGLFWEQPVKVIAASATPLTGASPLIIDGYTVQDGDRVILNAQANLAENTVYNATVGGGSYSLTPAANPPQVGDAYLVQKGTLFANTAFVYTDASNFVQFSSITAYTAGAGIKLTGTQFSVDLETVNPTLKTTANKLGVNLAPSGGLVATSSGLAASNFATGDIPLTSFSALVNQTNQPVTGLAFSNASVKSFVAQVSVNSSGGVSEAFTLTGVQLVSGWDMAISASGEDSAYLFSINSSGQVLYSSVGADNATIKFRATVTTV